MLCHKTASVFPEAELETVITSDSTYTPQDLHQIYSVLRSISVRLIHYGDVIMGAIASQITSLTIVYSTVYSDADQRKRESSASLAFVRGIHRGPVNSPHKWPVTRKMFPFDDVIMSTIMIPTAIADCQVPNMHSTWYQRHVTVCRVATPVGHKTPGVRYLVLRPHRPLGNYFLCNLQPYEYSLTCLESSRLENCGPSNKSLNTSLTYRVIFITMTT